MTASGSFDVSLTPQKEDQYAAGRMLIEKTYSGDLKGSGQGQMLSKRTDAGVAVYSAIEEFSGTLDGKSGGFTLFHNGYMSAESQSLEITIIEGSGSGELSGITGKLSIEQSGGEHSYTLHYYF